MAFTTDGLYGWPSPAALRTAATELKTAGRNIAVGVGECVNGWAPVEQHFTRGAGREKILGAMAMPLAHGTAVEVAAESVEGYLDAFADEIEDLQARRNAVLGRISTFNSNDASDDESRANPEYGYGSRGEIQGKVDAIVAELVAAADKCAQDINKVDVAEPWFVDLITSKEGGLAGGLAGAGLTLSQFENVRVTRTTTIDIVFEQWKRTEVWVPSRVVTTPNGRYISMVGLVQEEFRRVHINATYTQSWLEKKWLNLRPEPNEFLFKNSEKYRNWVEAHPDRWVPPSQNKPSWWRVDQRLTNTAQDLLDANGWTRFAKGAGPVLALVAAGLTYADEYHDAKDELLRDHPDWSEEQIHERALYEAGLRGTTKVGLDLAAGATGAAIGTMIGGPVGTVVGFGIGIGASWLMDHFEVKDAVADFAVEATDQVREFAGDVGDAVSDAAGEVGDAVSDAWNSIF